MTKTPIRAATQRHSAAFRLSHVLSSTTGEEYFNQEILRQTLDIYNLQPVHRSDYDKMTEQHTHSTPTKQLKVSEKTLREQISVVAEFHAHKILPKRIAYRTGIDFELVQQLINGNNHQRLFKAQLALHRKSRRDQRLQKSLRKKGIAQATLQDQIEREFQETMAE